MALAVTIIHADLHSVYFQVSCGVVRLLLEYGANPDLLCEGHSALSLAIYSGNDLVRYTTY